jgi:hypothetical protein
MTSVFRIPGSVAFSMMGSNISGASAAVNDTLNTMAATDTSTESTAHSAFDNDNLSPNGDDRTSSPQFAKYVSRTKIHSNLCWDEARY